MVTVPCSEVIANIHGDIFWSQNHQEVVPDPKTYKFFDVIFEFF